MLNSSLTPRNSLYLFVFIKLLSFKKKNRTCSFTSLGQLGKGMVKWLNGAAGHLKKVETLRSIPRDDGLLPQQVAGLFRFRTRAMIQAAILMGNACIARSVGL